MTWPGLPAQCGYAAMQYSVPESRCQFAGHNFTKIYKTQAGSNEPWWRRPWSGLDFAGSKPQL